MISFLYILLISLLVKQTKQESRQLYTSSAIDSKYSPITMSSKASSTLACLTICLADEDCVAVNYLKSSQDCEIARNYTALEMKDEPGWTRYLVLEPKRGRPMRNVASLNGTTCFATSNFNADFTCERAFDGVFFIGGWGNAWAIRGSDFYPNITKNYIEIMTAVPHRLAAIQFWQRVGGQDNVKSVACSFIYSDQTWNTMIFTLNQTFAEWQSYNLPDQSSLTSTVRVTILEGFQSGPTIHYGFTEIELLEYEE